MCLKDVMDHVDGKDAETDGFVVSIAKSVDVATANDI